MLEAKKRSLRKMAYKAILRCKVGDGAVVRRILRETVLLMRTVSGCVGPVMRDSASRITWCFEGVQQPGRVAW
jgi:hypothetical protein